MNAATRTLSADPTQRLASSTAPAPRAQPAAPVARTAPRATASPPADAEGAAAARILAGARPWWFAFPGVMLTCANVVLAPLRLAVQVAEAAVALALLAAVGLVLAWHFGYVADRDVVAALRPVGQRILAMVQSAGGG